MSKKDYERAALIVQGWNDERPDNRVAVNGRLVPSQHVGQYIADAFVQLFRDDNPRFDVERFRRACVPGANVRARGPA